MLCWRRCRARPTGGVSGDAVSFVGPRTLRFRLEYELSTAVSSSGVDPVIHLLESRWMPGSSPGMTPPVMRACSELYTPNKNGRPRRPPFPFVR